MKVLLDTNILLDYLLNRNDAESAITLLQLGNAHCLDLMVTDLTIANIAYITRKFIAKDEFFRVMKQLMKCFSIIPMGEKVVNAAFEAEWSDFEDSLQYFAALAAGADCIISRNVKDYVGHQIPVCTSTEFVASLKAEMV